MFSKLLYFLIYFCVFIKMHPTRKIRKMEKVSTRIVPIMAAAAKIKIKTDLVIIKLTKPVATLQSIIISLAN